MVRLLQVLVAALAVLGCLGAGAGSAQAAQTLTTSGSGSGTQTFEYVGASTFSIAGTSTGTLGAGTVRGVGSTTGATTFQVTATTTYGVGTLNQVETGVGTGANTSTVNIAYTGGTGLFTGATGSAVVHMTGTPTANPQVNDISFTSNGTITLGNRPSAMSWSAPEIIDPARGGLNYSGLSGVSCPATTLCVVAGAFGDAVSTSNPTGGPSAWHPTPLLDPNGLISVSCASTVLCVMGDDEGSVLTSTAPTLGAPGWSKPLLIDPVNPLGTAFRGLTAVSCPSSSLCVFGDQSGSVVTSKNPTGGAAAWSTPADVDASNQLNGVSCASTRLCVAVDNAGKVVTSTEPTRGKTGWHAGAIDGTIALAAVSCASTRLCVAVDSRGGILTTSHPAAGATSWRLSANLGSAESLTGISCHQVSRRTPGSDTHPVLCAAVSSDGDVFDSTAPTGPASGWHVVDVSGTDPMSGVSCPSVDLCVATVVYGEAVIGTG